MKDVNVTLRCTSEWLPLKYDGNEPYVTHNGNVIMIRDLIRFEDKRSQTTTDAADYFDEARFPRFIETAPGGTEIRLWELAEEDDTYQYLETDLADADVSKEIVDVLKAENIHTVGQLINTPKGKLIEITKGNNALYIKVLSTRGRMRSVLEMV